MAKILKQDGADPPTMAKIYRAVIQAVLLYGAESWTVSDANLRKLRAFHHQAVRYMTGDHIWKLKNDEWEYPDHNELREKCGVLRIEEYIEKRRENLRTFLTKERKSLWEEAMKIQPPARDVRKILWWKQKLVSNEDIGQEANGGGGTSRGRTRRGLRD